jgi:hypothetical protein
MILPANHLLKYIPGVLFDFRFQYIQGPSGSTNPVDLTNYTAQWIVTDTNGAVITYHLGTTGHSGIFFGGDGVDPTNGIIDLILIANDTTALLGPANYQFLVTPPEATSVPLLFGSIINANTELYIGNPPPTNVINGGNAFSIFNTDLNGGGA